jgi:hypothetical protein
MTEPCRARCTGRDHFAEPCLNNEPENQSPEHKDNQFRPRGCAKRRNNSIHGERHLRHVLNEFLAHYNGARSHRTLRQLSPLQAETASPEPINLADYRLSRKPILGGLTSEYRIAA